MLSGESTFFVTREGEIKMDVQKIKELAEGYLDEQVELLKKFAAIFCESNDV